MKASHLGWALSLLLLLSEQAEAIRMPMRKAKRSNAHHRLSRRTTSMLGGTLGNGSQLLDDSNDVLYLVNITIGGSPFEVQIDTGSSDLWVQGEVLQTHNTSGHGTLSYGSGSVFGFVNTATVQFDDFTIEDQSYFNVLSRNGTLPDQGILGLGPNSSSDLRIAAGNASGDTVLDRIFRQNMSTPNFITVLLSRTNLTGSNIDIAGQLTIGDVIDGLENITSQPKLPAEVNPLIQHWQTSLDANGVIGPDGKVIQTVTTVPNATNPDQLRVVLDSGATFAIAPAFLIDAIYSRIPGAVFVDTLQNANGSWVFPCDYELNVTLRFSGVDIPIHPLDLSVSLAVASQDPTIAPDACISTLTYGSDILSEQHFDALLGDVFLRNTYSLFNFGDFIDGSNASVADPYIQLLPILDRAQAHLDFVNARLGGLDSTGSQAPLMNASSTNKIPFIPFFLGGPADSQASSNSSSDSTSVSESKQTESSLNTDDDDASLTNQNKSVDDAEDPQVKDEMPFASIKVASDGSVHINGWFIISMIFISISVILIFWILISAILRRRRANRIDTISSSRLPVWAGRGRSYGRVSNPKGREESPIWDIEKTTTPQTDRDDSDLLPYPEMSRRYEEPHYQGGGI